MLNFILGGASSGKTSSILEKIGQMQQSGREVLVIIPEQFSFEYEHILYNALGAFAFNCITVKSFSRLSSKIIEECECSQKTFKIADNYTKTVLMALAVRQVCEKDGLLYYSKHAFSADFSSLMLDCASDLQQSGLEIDDLLRGSAVLSGTIKEKFRDILNIYIAYNELLTQNGLCDSLSMISHAALLAKQSSYFENKVIFVDEFKSFTNDEKQLLGAMMSQSDVFLALDTNDESSSLLLLSSVNHTYTSLKMLAQTLGVHVYRQKQTCSKRKKNADIVHLSEHIFRNGEFEKAYSQNIKIVDAVNVYNECEYICAEIRRLVEQENYRFGDIAVVTRNAQSYESVFSEYARIYNIPVFESLPKSPVGTALSIFIETTLELCTGKIETEKILRYAKTLLTKLSVEEISELENFCYIWDIDGELWLSPFTQNDELAQSAEITRKKLIEPIIELQNECGTNGAQITKAVYKHFERIGLRDNLKNLCENYNTLICAKTNDMNLQEKLRELKMLWNIVMDIFDVMYKYLGERTILPEQYKELFLCALSKAHYTNAPQRLDCVSVSQIQLTRLNAPKVVFIMGANEGYFPRNCIAPGLFSDSESMMLSRSGIELAKTDEQIYSEECFAAYAAVCAPSDKLYITYPLMDKSGASCSAAYTLSTIKDMFENSITLCAESLDNEFYCSTKEAAYRRYVSNFSRSSDFGVSCEEALKEDPVFAQKINALKNSSIMREHVLKDTANILKLYGSNVQMSASRLETYCSCPFKYFMNYGLKLRPLMKKAITVNERGSIVHFCLENIFNDYKKDDFLALDKQNVKAAVDGYIKNYLNDNLGGDFRKNARFDFSLNTIAENVCAIIENMQREFLQSEFYPKGFEYRLKKEYRIDMPGPDKPKITLNGITDRVDIYQSGDKSFLRVIDYKTGKKSFSLSDLLCGKNMQMFLYLFALTDLDGDFSNSTPAGVLYYPALGDEPSLGRNACEDEVVQAQNKRRRMKGVVLYDDEVINAMDKRCGTFIPVKRKNDGNFDKASEKNLLTKEQFGYLDRYCSETIKRCGKRILSGEIGAVPLENACDFCDYKNACSNYPQSKTKVICESSDALVKKMIVGNYNYGDSFEIITKGKEDEPDVDE